ncbi:MAG: sodium:proton antiporter [Lachnospiraceae bacterium]|nr:sodium:proton antiporter [Lachnospiraceae bacterium]
MTIEAFWNAYSNFAIIAFILLGIIAVLCLLRAIIGPRTADRVVAINMLGTMAMAIIAVLFVKLREGYLADICLIYAMISFLAVIVLSKVYVGAYKEKKKAKEEKENGNN